MNILKALPFHVVPQFIRYLFVGGFGFVVDAGGMEALIYSGVNVYAARVFSMGTALVLTYLLHRKITFHDSKSMATTSRQFSGYAFCQLMAATMNYLTFFVLLHLVPQPVDIIGRLFSLCCGTGVGLMINYFMLRHFVFSSQKDIWHHIVHQLTTNKRIWIWLVLAAALSLDAYRHQLEVLAIPYLGHDLNPWDPDIWMRLKKVREWLAGGDFFDRSVPRTNAPYGDITTPWTRPVDFLLAFLVRLLPASFTLDQKLMLAATWMPPAICLGMLYFLNRAALAVVNNIHVMGCALFLMMINNVTVNYISPGNADHHGLLTLLWAGLLSCLMLPPSRRIFVVAGFLLGLMLWVSPEALMLIAVIYSVYGVYALFRPREMEYLSVLTLSAAAVSALALFAEVPFRQYFSYVHNDTLSIVYVTLMSLTAAGAIGLNFFFRTGAGLQVRILAVILAGAGVLLAMHFAYPRFFLGPYADSDPFITGHFLPNNVEVRSVFKTNLSELIGRLYTVAIAVFFLALRALSPRRFLENRPLVLLTVLLAITFTMLGFEVRWEYYLQPIAILIIAINLPVYAMAARTFGFRWLRHVQRMMRPYVCLAIIFVAACGGMYFTVKMDKKFAYGMRCQSQMRYLVESGQLQKKLGDKPLVLLTQTNIGGDVLFFTPYKIIAGNYHREGKGLADWMDILVQEKAFRARPLVMARKVDALLVCPVHYQKKGWLHKLTYENHPAWLQPVRGLQLMKPLKPASANTVLLFKVIR